MARFGRDEGNRSSADREAARLERERRRALREGRPPPEALPATDEPSFDPYAAAPSEPVAEPEPAHAEPAAEPESGHEEPAHEPEPVHAEPAHEPEPGYEERAHEPEPVHAEPAAVEPEPVHAEPAAVEPVHAEPAAVEPEPGSEEPGHAEREPASEEPAHVQREPAYEEPAHVQREPAHEEPVAEASLHDPEPPHDDVAAADAAAATSEPAEPPRRSVSLPRPQTDRPGPTTGPDRPSGMRRARRQPPAEYQAQPGAPGMPPHRSLGVRKRRGVLRRLLPVLVLLLLIGAGVFAFLLFQPGHGKGYGRVAVRIPNGAGASQIGDVLAKANVIDSGFFFGLRARLDGKRSELRAGTYSLQRSMTYAGALKALTTSPTSAPVIAVTLPEGPSRRELAAKVKAAGVTGSYLAATKRSKSLKPSTYGAPRATRTLEGFLFPDTYQLRRSKATARRLVGLQVAAFKATFGKLSMATPRRRNLSRYDVLIIASMIEREALVPKDRALISAVIYNRLKQGIPLGIDATLRYKLGNFSAPLKQSELKLDSAYNTRTRKGLPPTPIGNPGLASLRAAAAPAKANVLYYVVKPCGKGAHSFSSSFAAFQRDVAAYDRKRRELGGKSPVTC